MFSFVFEESSIRIRNCCDCSYCYCVLAASVRRLSISEKRAIAGSRFSSSWCSYADINKKNGSVFVKFLGRLSEDVRSVSLSFRCAVFGVGRFLCISVGAPQWVMRFCFFRMQKRADSFINARSTCCILLRFHWAKRNFYLVMRINIVQRQGAR